MKSTKNYIHTIYTTHYTTIRKILQKLSGIFFFLFLINIKLECNHLKYITWYLVLIPYFNNIITNNISTSIIALKEEIKNDKKKEFGPTEIHKKVNLCTYVQRLAITLRNISWRHIEHKNISQGQVFFVNSSVVCDYKIFSFFFSLNFSFHFFFVLIQGDENGENLYILIIKNSVGLTEL